MNTKRYGSYEGFSKVACSGEYCFNNTLGKIGIQNPNQNCQISLCYEKLLLGSG